MIAVLILVRQVFHVIVCLSGIVCRAIIICTLHRIVQSLSQVYSVFYGVQALIIIITLAARSSSLSRAKVCHYVWSPATFKERSRNQWSNFIVNLALTVYIALRGLRRLVAAAAIAAAAAAVATAAAAAAAVAAGLNVSSCSVASLWFRRCIASVLWYSWLSLSQVAGFDSFGTCFLMGFREREREREREKEREKERERKKEREKQVQLYNACCTSRGKSVGDVRYRCAVRM